MVNNSGFKISNKFEIFGHNRPNRVSATGGPDVQRGPVRPKPSKTLPFVWIRVVSDQGKLLLSKRTLVIC